MIIKSFKYAFILILSSSIIACQSNSSEAEVKDVSTENDVVSLYPKNVLCVNWNSILSSPEHKSLVSS